MLLKFRRATHDDDETHEDLFMRRYQGLRKAALQLTAHDTQLAEDLVHEAYVQFTLARTELHSIQNLDAYLYGMLRKLNMSHLRRASRLQYVSSFLVDYDTLELGLRAMDLGAQIRVQDELRLICHFGCVRKGSSKAGSVLLLRFFHGYYPSEIAKILVSPRSAVDDWLRIARREAKRYMDDPRSLSFMADSPALDFPQTSFGETAYDVMNELRRAIFEGKHPNCFSDKQLGEVYVAKESEAVSSGTLAQIVSCPQCLDRVNQLLGLPPLSERFPADMLGPDTTAKGKGLGKGK
jgi:RNA polymerase sigma factor (sigma-70 family)